MIDEATDASTTEQMSICVRYYVHVCNNDDLEICEEFIGFCSVTSTDSETLLLTF